MINLSMPSINFGQLRPISLAVLMIASVVAMPLALTGISTATATTTVQDSTADTSDELVFAITAGADTGSVVAINASSGDQIWSKSLPEGGGAIAVSDDDSTLYVGMDNGEIQARNVSDGSLVWNETPRSSTNGLRSFAVTDNGTRLFAGYQDGSLYSVDPDNGQQQWNQTPHTDRISA